MRNKAKVVMLSTRDETNMEKILKDRLNHLKSDLATEKHQKMDKVSRENKIYDLEIRISECEYLLKKL